MQHYITLTNSEIADKIGEIIHSERDRNIMSLRLIQGYTYEKIGELCEMSVVQIKRIVKKYLCMIL